MNKRAFALGLGSRHRKMLAAVIGAALAAPAAAVDFTLGGDDSIQGAWNTTVTIGSAWRMQGRSPALYAPANGNQQGLPTGVGANSDDGDLNFGKGDPYTTSIVFITDVELKKDGYGGLIRLKGWYDYTLNQRGVPHGNEANNYVAGQALSDGGFEPLAKFQGIYLLDAYAYGNWKLDDNSLNARIGRQVVNWGESLFIQGVNQISPIDVTALRRPGTEIKEALIPVDMVYGNYGFASGPSVEAFYQFQWEPTTLDGCGTFFSTVDASIGPNAASSGCPAGLVSAPDSVGYPSGLFVPLTTTVKPHAGNEYGASLKYFSDKLDTDFGAYAMNIHSRTPVLSGIKGLVPFQAQAPLVDGQNVKAFWDYPENIHIFGLSAATTLGGWSVGSEVSYTNNLPVQIAAGDLVAGLLYPTIPALGPAGSQFNGPLHSRVAAAPVGGVVQGYDRANKTQLQLNAVKAFSNVLGAENLALAGEVAGSWAGGLNPNLRYGRAFVFGIAQDPSYGPLNNAVTGGCPPLNSPNQPGCQNAGFFSTFAWGYRLRGQLDYNNVGGTGVTVSPSLYWQQDVKGYSVDNQFNQGRQVIGAGVNFAYGKRYNLSILYTWYADSAQWDPLRDRDNLAVSASVSF